MTDDQKRRIDDYRPAIALNWEDANTPPVRAPFARPNQWTILLTSAHHGLVGAYGHNFPHAAVDHVRVNVCDEAIVASLRERVCELEAATLANVRPGNPGADVTAAEAKLYRDLTGDALALGYDCIPAALAAISNAALQPGQPSAEDVRAAALEEAAALAVKLTAVPRDVLGPATAPMKDRARAGEKVAAAIRALTLVEPPASQNERTPTDGHLLDYLDTWVATNKAEGWGEFNFCFNTSGTAREQIAEQIKDDMASQTEGGAA